MLTAPVLVCSGRRIGTATARTRRLRTPSFESLYLESLKFCPSSGDADCRIAGSHPPSRGRRLRRKLGARIHARKAHPMNIATPPATALSSAPSLEELYPLLAER